MNKNIIIYETNDGAISVNVKVENETVWLSLDQISNLFKRNKSTVSRHIKNIFEEEELFKESTVAKFATVQNEGHRTIERVIEYYNLDVIISVGYRVKSIEGTRFRQRPNKVNDYAKSRKFSMIMVIKESNYLLA